VKTRNINLKFLKFYAVKYPEKLGRKGELK